MALDGQDPEVLRAIVEEQRERARTETRSVRLFLVSVHAEYAMPGSRERQDVGIYDTQA